MKVKLNIIIYLVFVLCFLSCSKKHINEKENKKEIKLTLNELMYVTLESGEIISIQSKPKGFDLLYLGDDLTFSLHKKDEKFRNSIDFTKNKNKYSIADLDGDFLPDILFNEFNNYRLNFSKTVVDE